MKISFKKSFMLVLTLLVLVFSALGTTPAYATWVFNNKTTTNGLGNNLVRSVYVNGSTVYAGTTGGLSISTDGGSTFSNKTSALNNLGSDTINGVFESAGTIYAATTVGLSYSVNGGTSFINRLTGAGLGSNTVFDVFVSGGTIYAATLGGLSISTDGGTSFTNRTTVDGLGNNQVNGVFVSGTTVYAATSGGLSISTDGGTSFISNKTTVDGLGSNTVNKVFESAGTLYAATDDGLAISTDGGTSFINRKVVPDGLGSNLVKGVFVSGSAVYAATTNGLSISINGGSSFTNKKVVPDGLADNNVKGVFASGTTVYAATNGGLSIGADIDITAPSINSFTATSPVGNFSIPITAFTALDDFAVTGYMITESSTAPLAGAGGWSGTAPTTYTVPGNASYTLYPWAKDAAGNVSAVYGTPPTVVVLDNTAPETNIDSQPSNPNNDTTPTFTFSGNDGAGSGVASFLCDMDGGGYASCTSPFTSSALSDGSHTFSVKATDNAANEDATPDSYTWTLDSAAPETSINSQPPNPDTDTTPTFTFSGNDGAGSGIASFMCKMDGGSFALCTSPFTSPVLTDGSHTFNVKATDNAANEDATPASYTWMLGTVAPSVPVLASPANSQLITDYTPFLDWGTSSIPAGTTFDHYQVQVATDAAFSILVTDVNITSVLDSFYTIQSDLASNTQHHWRVRAVNSAGGTSNWSAVRTFRTIVESPTLVSPSDGFSTLTLRPSFDWNVPSGPAAITGYTIQISKNPTFTQVVHTGNPVASDYVPTADLPTNLLLHWRVQTKGANGPSAWSDVRSFTNANPPSTPVLSLPAANALLTDDTPILKWSAVILPAPTVLQHYQLQVDNNADFSSPELDVTSPTNQFEVLTPLAHNTKFYWRVRALNMDNEEGKWSLVRYFRTIVDAPTNLSPINGFDAPSLRPSFDWDDVAGPAAITGYTIQISKNPTFTQIVHTGNPAASNYVPTADLPKGLELHWRARTRGVNGPSAWSDVRSFNSANSPTTPVLSLPAANALLTDDTPILKWSAVTLPAPTTFKHYQLQVDDNADFSSPVLDDTSITVISTIQIEVLTPLAHNTKFWWRVRALNTADEAGNWSAVRYFRTIVDAPTLVSPTNGSDPLLLRPPFDWADVSGSVPVTYTIQISKNETFTQIVHTGNPVASNYIPTADLPRGIALWWRVQTKGANGPSAWSDVWTFLSANAPTTPALSLPALNALNTNFTPLFKWSAVTVPAPTVFKHYQLQVDDTADFSSPVLDDTSITNRLTIQFQMPILTPLAHNTKFYWRVRAVNTDLEEGNWSAVRYFRTIVDAPILLSPANASPAGTLQPVFDWGDAVGPGAVTNYTIQVSAHPTFATILLTKTVVGSTYTHLTNLPAAKTLYWHVRVNGANGPSAWSPAFSFTTP